MAASVGWDELSVDSLEETMKNMESLEQEDVVYLQEFILGKMNLTSDAANSLSKDKSLQSTPSHYNNNFANIANELKLSNEDITVNNLQENKSFIEIFENDVSHLRNDNEVSSPKYMTPSDFLNNIDLDEFSDPDDPFDNDKTKEFEQLCIIKVKDKKNIDFKNEPIAQVGYKPKKRQIPKECELCGLKLANKTCLKRHILAKHIKEKTHVCPHCDKAFVFKFAFNAHLAIHAKNPKYECVCGKEFRLRPSYVEHIKRNHQAVSTTLFTCELCKKEYYSRHSLRMHLTSVHEPKTVQCTFEGCKKLFSKKSLMFAHYRYHLNNQYGCDKCEKTFTSKQYMMKHRLTHSGIRKYMCTECGKTYINASHLNQHYRRAHSTAKPFQCSFCGKQFKSKEYLVSHENKHKGEKPHKCHLCDYATSFSALLVKHKEIHKPKLNTNNDNKSLTKRKTSISKYIAPKTKKLTSKKKLHVINSKTEKSCSTLKEKEDFKVKSSNNQQKSDASSKNSTKPNAVRKSSTFDTITEFENKDFKIGNTYIFKPSKQATPATGVLALVKSNEMKETANVKSSVDKTNVNLKSQKDAQPIQVKLTIQSPSDVHTIKNTEQPINLLMHELAIQTSKNENENSVENCVIFSNNGRCAIPNCENQDDNLCLLSLDNDKFIAVCINHALPSPANHPTQEMSRNSCDESKVFTLPVLPTTSNDHMREKESLPSVSYRSLLQDESPKVRMEEIVHHDVDKYMTNSSDFLLQNIEPLKNSSLNLNSIFNKDKSTEAKFESLVVCSNEFSSLIDGDGMETYSVPLKDTLFGDAEIMCPICDRVYNNMDCYVTHLECDHN